MAQPVGAPSRGPLMCPAQKECIRIVYISLQNVSPQPAPRARTTAKALEMTNNASCFPVKGGVDVHPEKTQVVALPQCPVHV